MNLLTLEREARATLRQQGTFPPTIFLHLAGKEPPVRAVIQSLPATFTGKLILLFQLGHQLGRTFSTAPVRSLGLILEAWLSEPEAGQPLTVTPSADPQRREICLLSILTVRDLNQQARVLELLRDETGALTDPRVLTALSPEGVDSTMVSAWLLCCLAGILSATPQKHRRKMEQVMAEVAEQLQHLKAFDDEELLFPSFWSDGTEDVSKGDAHV